MDQFIPTSFHEDEPASPAPGGIAAATAALGVVFGDIATSPLYALQAAMVPLGGSQAPAASVIGVISLIFWALTIIVSLKYVAIVLRADNEGEGGILALVSLVTEDGHGRLGGLLLVGVIGAALLYGDGAVTPAISVLSAIEGIKVVTPQLAAWVVPLTVLVLIGLFAMQRRGTGNLGSWFGPVMVLWLLVLAAVGLRGIAEAPAILQAVDPRQAWHMLGGNPTLAFTVIGLIFLALTGAEALYADMGHFGAGPIRLAWFALAFPALLLNYFGQGGWLLAHPGDADNPFYKLIPEAGRLPMVALAAAATVIASQALISGVFSLTRQAISMRLMPRMMVIPTSSKAYGQIYVPVANWALMAVTVLIVISFKTSDALANAYGVAVSATMLATTILLYRVMTHRWRWPAPAALLVAGPFALVDAAFFSSNAMKFVEGGWLPVAIGAAVALCMLSWRIGSSAVQARLAEDSMPMDRFLADVDQMVVARLPGCGIFVTRVADRVSPMLLHHVRHNRVLHENVILATVELSRQPRVPAGERVSISEIGHGIYRLVIHIGFMQRPDLPAALKICERLGYSFCTDPEYYIAHEGLVRRAHHRLPAAVWMVYRVLHALSLRAADYFHLPPRKVMEVGFRLEV